VTTREQLHRIIDFLDQEQVNSALNLLEPLADSAVLPDLVAIGARVSEPWVAYDVCELRQPTRCTGRHRRW
jgi:hypothetical protein